ncbi:MAG TPA: hypothetical protein VES20_10405, partial [Bryobacteraceae bacterium]|nr:hypothetical protein [Bryobacteraceae bacterium]
MRYCFALSMLWAATCPAAATPLFSPGTLLWASQGPPIHLFQIAAPDPLPSTSRLAELETRPYFQFGQLAISPDRQYAYASLTDLNAILRISADGQFEEYATLRTPTGLVFHDGRLFAGQWDGKVFDITEGNTSTVYALGFR